MRKPVSQLGKMSRNEIRKYKATFINGVALGLIAVGAIAPLYKLHEVYPEVTSWKETL